MAAISKVLLAQLGKKYSTKYLLLSAAILAHTWLSGLLPNNVRVNGKVPMVMVQCLIKDREMKW